MLGALSVTPITVVFVVNIHWLQNISMSKGALSFISFIALESRMQQQYINVDMILYCIHKM